RQTGRGAGAGHPGAASRLRCDEGRGAAPMKMRLQPLTAFGLVVLGATNIWLVTAIADWSSADRAVADNAEWDPDIAGSIERAAPRKPISAHKETLTHPIFFKTRMPFVPPPPLPATPKVVAPPPIVDPGLVLGGVMIEKQLKKAYVFTKANPQGSWMKEGEEFLGWKVQSVDSKGVTLQQQGRTIELKLYPTN